MPRPGLLLMAALSGARALHSLTVAVVAVGCGASHSTAHKYLRR
jgi:hypothetical protein